MRKRNMKFLAMFLSLTMVFSMNTFAFGAEASLDEIPGEAVQAEVAEGKAPEVVKLNPADATDYGTGLNVGRQAGEDDQALGSGKTDNYEAGKKIDAYKDSEAYAAGFEDGYAAYAHEELFSSFRSGFDQGYFDAENGGNTDEYMDASKVKDADKWRYIEPLDENGDALKDQKYIDAYQSAYKKGVELGKKSVAAANNARNYVIANALYISWTTAEAYLASKDFKDLTETGALKDKTADYVTAWKNGLTAAYDYEAKDRGLAAGKDAAQADKNANFDPVSNYDTQEKAVEYIKKFSPANEEAYRRRWKTYNGKSDPETTGDYVGRQKAEADADGDNIPVGNTYLEYYKKGYDAVVKSSFNVFGKQNNLQEKNAFNQGFADGWAAGALDYGTDKEDNKEAAKKEGSWYTYCETNKDIHTAAEIEQYQAGFEYAYAIAVSDAEGKGGQYDAGYQAGRTSGAADAARDRYSGTPYDGFYEPSNQNSAYNVATGEWGKGYKAGYDEAYIDAINPDRKKAGKEVFDYTAADMDAWRISSDPTTWVKAQLLVNQKDTFATYNDTYLDTAAFAGGRPEFTRHAHNAVFSDGLAGEIVATSPFQYYFDLYDTDHLIDKKTVSGNLRTINDVYVNENEALRDGLNNGSVGEYLYAAFTTPSSNKAKKPKKGVSDNGATYVLVRYRLAGADTYENYMVRRYTYDKTQKESVVTETINNYYQGTDKDGNVVNEPVVQYDSRKIAGVKPLKEDPEHHESNDKANRYIIDAEALVVTWQAGAPAKLIGKLDLNVSAKDNVNATVPHRYLEYLGEAAEIKLPMAANEAGDNFPNAIEFAQDDIRGFSKYYKVTKSNEDLTDGQRAVKRNVTLAGTKSVPKLSAPSKNGVDINGSNAYMNKKGASPSFTLKAKSKDPLLKPYMKDVKTALKKATFTFEISRMKLASDYISDADHLATGLPEDAAGNRYSENIEYEDTVLSKDLNDRFTPAPSRYESGSDAAYEENVKKFEESFRALKDYASIDNKEFQDKARKEFEATVTALRNQYNELKTKYAVGREVLQAWIEDEDNGWARNHKNDIVFFGQSAGAGVVVDKFPYKVTKVDRTGNGAATTPVINAGIVIPVENSYAYKALVPEDLNCNGEITAVEHYLYWKHVTNGGGTVDDPWFSKTLEDGDNIVIPANLERLIKGNIEFDTVTAAVTYWDDAYNDVTDWPLWGGNAPTKIGQITFTYDYDYKGQFDQNAGLTIELGHDAVNSPDTFGKYMYDFGANAEYQIYIDFLQNRDLDIQIVEDNATPGFHVLYPGTAELTDADGNPDFAEIYFTDPKVKASKKAATLDVKPVLKLRISDGWLVAPDPAAGIAGTLKPLAKNEKKLKVFTLKAGVSANTLKKLPKADVQMEQKMAETEPFIVATGINNYEGSIAIRQRKNGDLGYGYFKDDDFYYIFSDEE